MPALETVEVVRPWGFDARRELAELVTDFAPLIEAVTEEFEAPRPLPAGRARQGALQPAELAYSSA